MTTCLMAAMLLTPMTALAANNGPSGTGYEYVILYENGGKSTAIYRNDGESYKVSGISYNKATNTMTINNVNQPNKILEINEMGEDFKLVVKGTNALGGITVWGYGYGGSLTITGSGSLTLNKNKIGKYAILMKAEQSPSKLTINKGVNLTAYAASGYDAFAIEETTYGTKALNITGTTSINATGKSYYSYEYGGTTYKTPSATAISKIAAKTKGFTVTWKKQTSATGYQISYATNSSFKSAKTVTVSKNSTVSKTISSLSAKKKYYVRVRTYRTVDGVKVYSNWSTAKTVTTK